MKKITSKDIDAHVGARLRTMREARGISQTRVGNALGLTFAQIQKYEKGVNRIGAGKLYLLAKLFDVGVSDFYEGMK